MDILSIANENFYLLIIIVIGLLSFIDFKEVKRDNNLKNDKVVTKALIWIYSIGTIGIFVTNLLS